MAALTTGSWTIAFRNGNQNNSTRIENKKRFVDLKLTLTTGESPATGVPLPNYGSLGMVRNLEYVQLHNDVAHAVFTTARGRAIKWVVNATANRIIPYQVTMNSGSGTTSGGRALRACATNLSITGAKVFYITAVGW
jgi:hypothetical protein